MKKITLLLLLLCIGGQVLLAQKLKVTGKITDAANGTPIEGASIKFKDGKVIAVTSPQGIFNIKADKGQTIIAGSIGYANKEVTITSEYIEIQLTVDSKELQDVVVVGYGSQKKGKITGAVATVTGDQIIRRPSTTTSMGLQGMAPGVTVRQSSGQPGADQGTINIRGYGSIGASSAPLFVVDGVESANINDLDPNMIESVSILKDAASSAVYGARATNGVILIKTKRGQSGKTSLSFNSFVSGQTPTNMPKTLSAIDHMVLFNEYVTNAGGTAPYSAGVIND